MNPGTSALTSGEMYEKCSKEDFFGRIRFTSPGIRSNSRVGRSSGCRCAYEPGSEYGRHAWQGWRQRRCDRVRVDSSGSSALELALALPALLAIILWLMTTGFQLYSQGVVASAAREAARHVAIHGQSDVEAVINSNLNYVLPKATGHVANIIEENDMIEVRITVDYVPFVDISQISRMLGGNITTSNKLRAAAHFRNERPGPWP